jgi:transcriptional regulator with XRE-family HTH domain
MTNPSPSELRNMLGANLRELAKSTNSISALCREIGINRTQFNRYLSGESFPRPDVLFRICRYFDVDARIILEPLADIGPSERSLLAHPDVEDFLSAGVQALTEAQLPSGFYQFVRKSFLNDETFVRGLIYVYRKDDAVFLRGLEAKAAMEEQGLPTDPKTREFRGLVMAAEGGIAALVSRRNSLSISFNFFAQIASFENNQWAGYAVRTARESVIGSRTSRAVYEHLGQDTGKILSVARQSGFCAADELLPYQRSHLRVGEPFY